MFCGFEAVYVYKSLREYLLFILGLSLGHSALTRKEIRGWSASILSVDPGDAVHLKKPQPSRTEDWGTQKFQVKGLIG